MAKPFFLSAAMSENGKFQVTLREQNPVRVFLLLVTAAVGCAQAQPRQANPGAPVKSPEVQPDGHVIFRIYAPKASAVDVTGDFVTQGFSPARKLVKDERGVWSVTVGPLPPDLYTYVFDVDGVRTVDPKNGNVNQATETMPGGAAG